MDPEKLPYRALIDTGILTRALVPEPDSISPVCHAFVRAMLAENRELVIAAPTIAEFIRKDGTRTIPRIRRLSIANFDEPAAEILGRRMPMAVLKEVRDVRGVTLTHLKYDALIVACAARARVDCIVAIDRDIALLAQHVGLAAYSPEYYLSAQVEIPL